VRVGTPPPMRCPAPVKFQAFGPSAAAFEEIMSVTATPTPDAGARPDQPTLERELAVLFVNALNLELDPAAVDPTAPIYGDGLGLDSIDILEVALEVSRRYGFQLRSDDADNERIFQSLRSLALHVAKHRTA
jgi:acyl carrier protein